MDYDQTIPFYVHKFQEHPWRVFETEHYTFHVEVDSLAENEIESIKQTQELAYTKIINTLKLSPPDKKIEYYFYSSRERKKELMGDDWYGQTIYNEFTVHAVYNEKDKVVGEHEDTHLLSLPLSLPISLFQEGLAESMVGRSMFGHSHQEIIKAGLARGLKPEIVSLMSQEGWLETPDEEAEFYYSLAGSFITYLLDIFGLGTFKKLYTAMERGNTQVENLKIFESITEQSLENAETTWLNGLGINPESL